jgi:acetolactate synthase-1/2/3 large subunit
MKKSGAWLARYALEQLPISHTFGIPGVHNTELYDELNNSTKITPILVTHEGCGAFMGDAISRVSDEIGCLLIVPAAGVTHAASGIGEAFLDGIPLLVIAGGIRSDSEFGYQLHEMDQHSLLKPITKQTWKIEKHEDIVTTLFEAYKVATSGEPGPVFVELPVNIQLDRGEVSELPELSLLHSNEQSSKLDNKALEKAAELIKAAKNPGLFVGWGAVNATDEIKQLAEKFSVPVATTLQGLSSFPANHPLHVGFGFGPAAVPSARNAFLDCDCLIAVGTRFGEIATGSYGVTVPENLIHIDINPAVFNRNYPAAVSIEGDSKVILKQLNAKLRDEKTRNSDALSQQIKADKKAYLEDWYQHDSKDRVNPARFFEHLRTSMADDATLVVDDGNHTFLCAELMPIHSAKGMISPTDFNCMGYAVPASIGAKFVRKDKQVVSVVGDGAFLMTAMELATATKNNLAPIICIFNDGELSQIGQAQERPYNRKTCSEIATVKFEGVAMATGCEYISINNNEAIQQGLEKAFALAEQNKAVIVDIKIDYSKPTAFTDGVVKTNIKRLPFDTKVRMIGRAIYRKITG